MSIFFACDTSKRNFLRGTRKKKKATENFMGTRY